MSKKDRAEWAILGRVIGTASGWNQGDTFALNLYDFEPAPDVPLPKGTPFICFESGKVEYWSEQEPFEVVQSFDLLDVLANARRKQLDNG
jgi:hypothetical protein